MQVIKARIGGFIPSSTADGPGVRSVLFFQGCSRGCYGCHNPDLQTCDGGEDWTIDELVELLSQKCPNKKLTISGGEPLEQPETLAELVKRLARQKYEICLYTCSELGDIPKIIRSYLRYAKVGAFDDMQRVSEKYYGSANQKFYDLQGCH